jgi:hypothetical protein
MSKVQRLSKPVAPGGTARIQCELVQSDCTLSDMPRDKDVFSLAEAANDKAGLRKGVYRALPTPQLLLYPLRSPQLLMHRSKLHLYLRRWLTLSPS